MGWKSHIHFSNSMIKNKYLICSALAVAAFAVAQLPLASSMQVHHPDERYYTDAALIMQETGDYMTPRFYSGETRPHKPILTYWILAASYRMFGISYMASRLPSIAAGMILLILTYGIGFAMTRRHDVAFLSTCIMETQAVFLLCSNRATPDIFMTTSLTLVFLGLVMQLRAPKPRVIPIALILLGSGIGVITKGLLGLVLLLFAGYFLRDFLKSRFKWGTVSIILWFSFISAWFLLMVLEYDASFIHHFLYDQIFGRLIKGCPLYKPFHIVGYLFLIPAMFLPWLLFFIKPGPRRERLETALCKPHSTEVTVMISWCVLCAFIFGMGNKVTPRYVLSTAPLLSVFIANVFLPPQGSKSEQNSASARRTPRAFLFVSAAAIAAALLSVPLTGGFSRTQILPACCFTIVIAIAMFFAFFAPDGVSTAASWNTLGLSMLAFFPLLAHVPLSGGVEAELLPVVERLQEDPLTQGTVLCEVHPSVLSRMRIIAGKSLPVKPARDLIEEEIPDSARTRIFPEFSTIMCATSIFERVETIRLPVSSLELLDEAMEATEVPKSKRFLNFLRTGYPNIDYHVEIRTALE